LRISSGVPKVCPPL